MPMLVDLHVADARGVFVVCCAMRKWRYAWRWHVLRIIWSSIINTWLHRPIFVPAATYAASASPAATYAATAVRVMQRILLTNSKVAQRESSGTTPRLDLLWTCCFSKQRGRYGVEIKIDALVNNLVSSKAGVLNGMLRSFLLVAPSRCESTQAHWAQVDLLRL